MKFGFNLAEYKAPQLTLVTTEPELEPEITVTIFHNIGCTRLTQFSKRWSEVCEMLRDADIIANGKLSAPMLKMATFGSERNPNDQQPDFDKRSLRYSGNLLTVTGIEADYDAGTMPMEEAVKLLEKAGIRAVLYSSWGDGLIEPPKYLGGPRWRVIAPFSRELPPEQRAKMVARLNGVLGGVLADESFTLAQGFFIGARPGGDYKCKVTFRDPMFGRPIDTLDSLDEIAVYKRNFSSDDSGDERYSVEIRPGSVVVAPEVYAELRVALSAIPADCDNPEWFSVLRGLSRLSNTMEARAIARDWSTSSPNPEHNDAVFNKEWARMSRENTTISHRKVMWLASQYNPDWSKGLAATKARKPSSLESFTLEPLTVEELRNAQLTPRIVLPFLLYADVRTRIAAGGVGKTTLALYEALTLALGRDLWGRTPERPVKTVLVTREDARETLAARMREMMKAMQLDGEAVNMVISNILIMDLSTISYRISAVVGDVVMPHTDNLTWLIGHLQGFAPDWVIMDPLVSFGVGEQRVNDAEQGLIEAMRILKKEFNCCVEGIHHSGKANAREKTLDQYSGRGGSALADGSRMVCVMAPLSAKEFQDATGYTLDGNENGLVMALPKMSYCRPQEEIYIKRSGYLFEAIPPLKAPAQQEVEQQIEASVYGAVHDAWLRNTPLTAQELKADFKALFYGTLKREEVTDALARLRRDGRVIQTASRGGKGARALLEPVIADPAKISQYAIPSEPGVTQRESFAGLE